MSQPAVLQTSYELPPPTYSPMAPPPPPQTNQALADSLQSRQEELERKAADLDRREKEMQREVNATGQIILPHICLSETSWTYKYNIH